MGSAIKDAAKNVADRSHQELGCRDPIDGRGELERSNARKTAHIECAVLDLHFCYKIQVEGGGPRGLVRVVAAWEMVSCGSTSSGRGDEGKGPINSGALSWALVVVVATTKSSKGGAHEGEGPLTVRGGGTLAEPMGEQTIGTKGGTILMTFGKVDAGALATLGTTGTGGGATLARFSQYGMFMDRRRRPRVAR